MEVFVIGIQEILVLFCWAYGTQLNYNWGFKRIIFLASELMVHIDLPAKPLPIHDQTSTTFYNENEILNLSFQILQYLKTGVT